MEQMLSWDVLAYLLGLAALWGSLQARLRSLEKKVEKHNGLVERLCRVEDKSDWNTACIEELKTRRQRGM